jgi:transposase InsO family protein
MPPAATASSSAGSSCTSASTTPPGWPYVEVLDDEKASTAVGFLRRAVAFYRSHGITAEAVMSDNGACYRSTLHAFACRTLGIRHLRTRPYRPRWNGKVCVSRSVGRPRWRRGSPRLSV